MGFLNHQPATSAWVKANAAGATSNTLGFDTTACHSSPCRRCFNPRVVPQAGQGKPVAERNGQITIFIRQITFSNSQATPIIYNKVTILISFFTVNLDYAHQLLQVFLARRIHNEEEVDKHPKHQSTTS